MRSLLSPSLVPSSCPDVHEESRSSMASMNHLASPSRADSLRSISSTNSNVSLTRRPRIRSRSGTTSSQRGKSRDQSPENLNYDELAVAYPQQPGPSSQNNAPPRPAKSPYRISASSATLSLSPAPTSSVQRPSTTDSSRGRNTGRRNVSSENIIAATHSNLRQIVQGYKTSLQYAS